MSVYHSKSRFLPRDDTWVERSYRDWRIHAPDSSEYSWATSSMPGFAYPELITDEELYNEAIAGKIRWAQNIDRYPDFFNRLHRVLYRAVRPLP